MPNFLNPSKKEEINTICEENNLERDIKLAPMKNISGKLANTEKILNDVSYKRKPLRKGVIPLVHARIKKIIQKKRKRRNRK